MGGNHSLQVTKILSLVALGNEVENVFNLSRNFSRPCDYRMTPLDGWQSLVVSHHLVMYSGHWSSASRDMIYLICPIISQDHVIKESSDLMGGSFSMYATCLLILVAIGIVVV